VLKQNGKRILECAHNPEMKIVFSNTTEVGIRWWDDITNEPPVSFPGKLLAFCTNGSKHSTEVMKAEL
jgi:tagaturonate reductase